MFPFLILPLTAVLVPSASSEAYCTTGGVLEKSYIDDNILGLINDKRSKLAHGDLLDGAGTPVQFPIAKAMNKLEWDCDLETNALGILNDCTSPPDATLASTGFYFDDPRSKGRPASYAVSTWVDEHEEAEFTNLGSMSTSVTRPTDFGNFAGLMHDQTTTIGCAELTCPDTTNPKITKKYLFCLTDKGPVADGNEIYAVDDAATDPCTACPTERPCNKETSLCEEPVTSTAAVTTTEVTTAVTTTTTTTATTTAAAETTTAASYPGELPEGTDTLCTFAGMTDELRMHFLDTQNYRRSILAKGQVQRPSGNYLPTGADIIKLRPNCKLEEEAIKEVRQCPTSKTPHSTYGKNFDTFASSTVTSTYRDAIKKAVTNWWKVVRKENNGPGMQVTFRSNHVNQPVETYTQIAWAKTTDLGCAIAKCSSSYTVICLYEPKGNIVEQPMYKIGSPCSACPTGTTCDSALGLCVQN